jgi:hypothetical protein
MMLIMELDRAAADLALNQGGTLNRKQALDLGMTPRMIQRRLSSGRWSRIGRAGYRLFDLQDPRERLRAALANLPDAVVSHESAAELHEIEGTMVGLAVVTVHTQTTHSFPGVIVRRSLDLAPNHRMKLDGLAVTTPARTIVDLAAVLDPRRTASVLDNALLRGRMSTVHIREVIEQVGRRGKPGIKGLRALLDERDGAIPGTPLERKGRELIERGGLPAPIPEYPIPWDPGRRFDDAYPFVPAALEWDSRAYHTRLGDFERDRARDRECAIHGWVMLRFTWDDVTARPSLVAHQLRAVLRRRLTT